MASHDVIGDMLTKVRNAANAGHKKVTYRFSKQKHAITKILVEQGFLESFETIGPENKKEIKTVIKYNQGIPVISGLKRISTPGRRIYKPVDSIPRFMNGLAVTIVSTSKGILTGKEAIESKQSGEILCYVW